MVLSAPLTVLELARLLGIPAADAEARARDLGETVRSEEDAVSADVCELLLLEAGWQVERSQQGQQGPDGGEPRPPIVAVMGHVDHGKTTLLDALRRTSVAAQEAGGITQHIGAFEVLLPGSQRRITFLDTPGHKAFGALRSRGAKVTDIVVLVVAADDGVMPQTREALDLARGAGCAVVVAVTKVDKPEADVDKAGVGLARPGSAGGVKSAEPTCARTLQVTRQLVAAGVELESEGGSVQVVPVSAPQGLGLVELEEALLLQAEEMGLQAPAQGSVRAWVVESRMDQGLGPVATVVLKSGTLRPGMHVVVGSQFGRIRALRRPGGGGLEGVGPGQAAEVSGLRGLPQAGDELLVCSSEQHAQRLVEARRRREQDARTQQLLQDTNHDAAGGSGGSSSSGSDLPWWHTRAQAEKRRQVFEQQRANRAAREQVSSTLNLVLRADVQGSLEALTASVQSLSAREVPVRVIAAGLGPVTEADVELAAAAKGHVLAFNTDHLAR